MNPKSRPSAWTPKVSAIDRMRSWRHAFWFAVSRRIRWSLGLHRETAAGSLQGLSLAQTARVRELSERYRVRFEQRLGDLSGKLSYEYLDILDCAWRASRLSPPQGGVVCDVGCASFSYAAALQAFFRPDRLIGVEIEGHRLLRDGHARIDYARGYVADMPGTEFMVADYAGFVQSADTITAWFPFLTPTAILAWRLPLSLLRPERLFASVKRNLKAGGTFVMINHGANEADLAAVCCAATGLARIGRWQQEEPLSSYRPMPPVLSWWRHADTDPGEPHIRV